MCDLRYKVIREVTSLGFRIVLGVKGMKVDHISSEFFVLFFWLYPFLWFLSIQEPRNKRESKGFCPLLWKSVEMIRENVLKAKMIKRTKP